MQKITQHSFKEQIDHALFESVPNKVDMWVKTIGNPNEVHQQIIELYGVFLDVCDKLQVKAWILFGSIIGYIRHKGIIPWEWDIDVGVSTEDYQKLLKQQTEYKNDNWEFVFYSDPPAPYYKGYPGETFCFRNKKTKILVNICEYKEVGDQLVPQVPGDYDPTEYDSYLKDEIYPLQRINICGFGSWLPKNPYIVLEWYKQDLSWYDPVPFILTKLYNPLYTEIICKPATKDVPEVTSFTEGIEKYGKQGLSFVVRKMQGIDLTLDMFMRYKMFGWDKQGQASENLNSKEILSQWEQDKLQINFVDSHAPNITTLKNTDMGKYVKDEDLMIILSNNHTYTPFHIDAVDSYYNEKYKDNYYKGWTHGGGGWMYLHKGQKLWQLLHPKFLRGLFNKEKNRINDLPVHELLYYKNHAMWGELEVTELNSGDFIYFSPGYIHRVWTYEKSYGIGGYYDFPENEQYKAAAKKYMKEDGVDVDTYPGIWF